MMNFNDFIEYVTSHILEYLPEEYQGARVKTSQIQKNNGLMMDAIIIETDNTNVFPTIYLNDFYKDYENDILIEDIMEKICDMQVSHALTDRLDLDAITNIDRVRDRVVARLINAEANKEVLKDRPHKMLADLAITYYIQLAGFDDAMATVAISNELAKRFNVTVDELHDMAIKNMCHVQKPRFINMAEMLASTIVPGFDSMSEEAKKEAMEEVVPPAPDAPMYIITNEQKTHGACSVLDIALMDEIHEKLGDVYILPSSIHELIVFPKNKNTPSVEELEGLVKEVNRTQVAEQDLLSDHVYEYNYSNHQLQLAVA